MTEEVLNIPSDTQNIEYHIVTLFEKLDALRRDSVSAPLSTVGNQKPPMQVEIRTLEFWRSIISECLASFFYVFIVCGAVSGAGISSTLSTALASGFAMATLTQCFGHVSGKCLLIIKKKVWLFYYLLFKLYYVLLFFS